MNTSSIRLSWSLVREAVVREQTLACSLADAWRRWFWAQPWWPVGLWWNGRVWLWQQRILALARLPLARGGWRSDPWQRPPARHLPQLMFVGGLVLGLWLVLLLFVSRTELATP